MRVKKFIPYIFLFGAVLLLGSIFSMYSADYDYISENMITTDKSEPISASATERNESNGLINLNTAGASELTELSGIGKSMAERIIRYRTENEKFEKIEDIMKVPGIGEKKFEQIKEHITV